MTGAHTKRQYVFDNMGNYTGLDPGTSSSTNPFLVALEKRGRSGSTTVVTVVLDTTYPQTEKPLTPRDVHSHFVAS